MPDTNVALSIGTPEIRCMEDHTPGRTKDVTRITRQDLVTLLHRWEFSRDPG
jgi:hypothetical protein